jgi:hypothetical protein
MMVVIMQMGQGVRMIRKIQGDLFGVWEHIGAIFQMDTYTVVLVVSETDGSRYKDFERFNP